MDGVLLNSELYHTEAEIKTFKRYGVDLTSAITSQYFGLRTKDYFKALAKRYKVKLPIEKICQEHKKSLEYYYKKVMPLTPHAKEVLKQLYPQYPMALATSTLQNLAETVLKRLSIFSYFQVKVYGNEVTKGKPNPEVFLKAASKLKVEPRFAVVIEDAENGFKAAKKAGMFVIAYKAAHNKNQNFSLADYIVDDLRKISSYLLKT